MTVPQSFPILAMGLLGGLAHEATRWISLRYEAALPAYFRRPHYWILTIVLTGLGGLLAWVLDAQSQAQAFAIGVSAPAIISRFGTTIPPKLKLGEEKHDLHSWFRG